MIPLSHCVALLFSLSQRERVRVRGFSYSLPMEHDYEVLELSVRKSSSDEILRPVRHPARPSLSPLR
jgi:hypothetical protein